MTENRIVLNYSALMAEYDRGLHEKLRNFTAGHEFLETWVPDEDTHRSVLGMLEAAWISRFPGELHVKIAPADAHALDAERLVADAAAFGSLRAESADQGLTLRFVVSSEATGVVRDEVRSAETKSAPATGSRRPDPSASGTSASPIAHSKDRLAADAHPAYRAALATHVIANEGPHSPPTGCRLVQTDLDGVTLFVSLDKRGRIARASHAGAESRDLERRLVDRFCEIIRDLSVQEAAEHGILRLAHALRDPAAETGVPGIATPENTEPAFTVPRDLARRLFHALRGDAAETPRNYWVDPLAPDWLALGAPERMGRLREEITAFCADRGLGTGAISPQTLEGDTRLTVTVANGTSGALLLELEQWLHRRLEPQLEVFLAERRDSNKPRETNVKSRET